MAPKDSPQVISFDKKYKKFEKQQTAKMFKIDYFIFKYFLTSKIAVLYKKMSNGSPLLNRILFFPKNKLFSVMSNCYTNCDVTTE
jgi:hypothetical protein